MVVMKAKYPVTYEGHPTPPVEGDMLIWRNGQWVKHKAAYSALPSVVGGETIWNPLEGLNRTISFEGSITIKIGKDYGDNSGWIKNGMFGNLIINSGPAAPFPSITLAPYIDEGTVAEVFGNGILSSLSTGIWHLCWVYDGTRVTYNIAKYDDTF